MKYLKLTIICFLAVGLTQCKTGKPDNFDYGSIKDNTYTNAFFAMSMDIPEGWAVQSEEAMKQMTELGKEMAAGDDQFMKAKLKVSEINTANLISAFEFEVGTPTLDFNSNVTLVAENMVLAPGVKRGSDYLKLTKQFLEQSQADYSFTEVTGEETFGGQTFDYMDVVLRVQGTEVNQRFYSTIINGFSFNAIISYGTDDKKEELIEILESMEFS